MKWKTMGGLFLLGLTLSGCSQQESKIDGIETVSKVAVSSESKSREPPTSPSMAGESDQMRTIANEFIYVYITQELDLTAIDQRKAKLVELLSEEEIKSSILMRYLDSLRYEVDTWEKQGKPNPSGGTFLQERQLADVTLFQEGDQFIAKVAYKEATVGQPSKTVQQYYEFQVVDQQIQNIKVIGN